MANRHRAKGSGTDMHPASEEEHDNPALSKVIERNIRTIIQLRLKSDRERSLQDRGADAVTGFSGSKTFVYLHVLWFAAWVLINSGRTGIPAFDPFPYGLLTMIVSLEAIFLATFVLISQNRTAAEMDHRADLDLQINLLTEHEITRVIRMLDVIGRKLEVELEVNSELIELEQDVKPQAVLHEMDLVQRRMRRSGKAFQSLR